MAAQTESHTTVASNHSDAMNGKKNGAQQERHSTTRGLGSFVLLMVRPPRVAEL